MGFQCMRRDVGVIAPDFMQQGFTRHGDIALVKQILQNACLFLGKLNSLIATLQRLHRRAENIAPDRQGGVFGFCILAHMGTNARQ